MVRIIIALLFCFPAVAFAQTYQQLSERAIECIEKDSLPIAEELLLQALKLEPKNAKNALLFSNLGLVQRLLGEFDKALESYSYHGSGLFIVNELIQWICVKSKQFGRQITLSRIR